MAARPPGNGMPFTDRIEDCMPRFACNIGTLMKTISRVAASLAILMLSYGGVMAQSYGDQRGGPQRNEGPQHEGRGNDDRRDEGRNDRGGDHRDWRRGQRVDRDEWQRGARFDYRQRHLSRPPRGYEWREFNGTYVLGAIATGIIANIILNGGR